MINKVRNLLSQNKKVSDFRITKTRTESFELFFVLKNLEMNRFSDITEYEVVIYYDFESFRGSAAIKIYDYMSDEEITDLINDGIYRASFVKNPYFEIPCDTGEKIASFPSNISEKSLEEWGFLVSKAIYSADKYQDGWINSVEIFLKKIAKRIINSKGIDYCYESYQGFIEVIPTFKGEKEEVELYFSEKLANINLDYITSQVDKVLEEARNRCNAVVLPADILTPIILRDNELYEIFNKLSLQLNYSRVFQKMNLFALNSSCQGENIKGDKLNIKLVPRIPESAVSAPIDFDGIVLKDSSIIENGIVRSYWGSNRFAYYIGEKNPTGNIENIAVEPGSQSIQDTKKSPYLECVSFSNLQVDFYSNYIGGEVRLGYYHDGDKVVPVTGFSISADLKEFLNDLKLSSEIISNTGYRGPKYLVSNKFKAL